MKFATYFDGQVRVGVVDGGDLWDLRELYSRYLFESERTPSHRELAKSLVPADMALFIRLHHGRLGYFEEVLEFARAHRAELADARAGSPPIVRPVEEARLLPPVPAPSKVICVGNSYAAYLVEQKLPKDEWPKDVKISFLKSPTALIGHRDPILFPPDSHDWDYENELTIVIGRTCSDVSPDEADGYVFGYSIINDACVRDVPKWTGRLDSPRGKACDTFAPFGPFIVPAAYLGGDPNDLHLRTTVDGQVRQDARTSGLLWPVQRIVAFVSRYIRLCPGDVISTGSATGNALTGPREYYLRPGQVVRCEIQGIGAIENPIGVRAWSSELPPLRPAG